MKNCKSMYMYHGCVVLLFVRRRMSDSTTTTAKRSHLNLLNADEEDALVQYCEDLMRMRRPVHRAQLRYNVVVSKVMYVWQISNKKVSNNVVVSKCLVRGHVMSDK